MTGNFLTKCQTCDCYIYCDPITGADRCFKSCTNNCKTGETSVKIIVRTQSSECNASSSGAEHSTDTNMKKLCCKGLCKVLKNEVKDDNKSEKNPKETSNQTSKFAMSNTKAQTSEQKVPDDTIYEYFKQNDSRKLPHGGAGCNTNTIIIPREKCGDCNPCLEGMIRNDLKVNTKILEDITNELHKQRREIKDIKETLEVIVHALREQFFMTSFGKSKNGLHDPFDDLRKNR